MVVRNSLIYIGIAAVVIFFLWKKKLGGASADTIIEGGISFEEQVVPGPPESQGDPRDHAVQDYHVAIGPLIGWLQQLRHRHGALIELVSGRYWPQKVRNNVVRRLANWRRGIDALLTAHESGSILIVSDFAAIANNWTSHMFWFDNINGHGVRYNSNEEGFARMARDAARNAIQPEVALYNNLDDNLLAWYETYGSRFVELFGEVPVSHLP